MIVPNYFACMATVSRVAVVADDDVSDLFTNIEFLLAEVVTDDSDEAEEARAALERCAVNYEQMSTLFLQSVLAWQTSGFDKALRSQVVRSWEGLENVCSAVDEWCGITLDMRITPPSRSEVSQGLIDVRVEELRETVRGISRTVAEQISDVADMGE